VLLVFVHFQEEVEKLRQERHMTVQGNTILKPLRKIEEAGFPGASEIDASIIFMLLFLFIFKSLSIGCYPS